MNRRWPAAFGGWPTIFGVAAVLLLAGCTEEHREPTSADPEARTAPPGVETMSSRAGDGSFHAAAPAGGKWNDHAAAFTFSSDDGYVDNLTWAPIFEARGWRYTLFVVSSWVGTPGKLTAVDLQTLNGQGFEIGSHSATHVRLTPLDDQTMTWEMRRSKVVLENIMGAHYRCRSIAYPFHDHDDRVMAEAAKWYEAARDGGTNPLGHPNYSEHYSNWGKLSLFEVPIAVTMSNLTGNNLSDEMTTRQRMRDLLALAVQRRIWINLFAHKLTDVDAEHMEWLLDEVAMNGNVWVGTFTGIAAYYKTHYEPFPTAPPAPAPAPAPATPQVPVEPWPKKGKPDQAGP